MKHRHHLANVLKGLGVVLALVGLFQAWPGAVRAQEAPTSIVVTSDADSGAGTLRQAIADIATGGTISFGSDMTVYLESTLAVARSMTIDGTGYSVTVSGDTGNDGTANTGIFDIVGGTATLRNLLLEKGSGTPDYGDYLWGGAIYVRPGAALSLIDSTISGCHANDGGAIFAFGALAVTGSTFSNNSADQYSGAIDNNSTGTVADSLFSGNSGDGGAIANSGTLAVTGSTFIGNNGRSSGGAFFNLHTLTVQDSTFSANSATSGGVLYAARGTATLTNNTFVGNNASYGGVYYLFQGSLTLRNNILAKGSGVSCYVLINNDPPIGGSNNLTNDSSCSGIAGRIYSLPGRIYSSNLLLGPLGSYGGSTQTYPLLPGSAAIDAGDGAYCPQADQRGMARAGTCDIGAFESQGFTLGSLTGTPQSAVIHTAFAEPLGLTVAASNAVEPVDGGLVTFAAPGSGASAALSGATATLSGGGTAGVTATANGTPGSYTVTAGTHGAPTDVSFALTNTYPQPVLDGISPASAVVGSADQSLAVTGSGFVAGSVVRWNGVDLTTAYASGSELSALVPAGNLAAVQTAQVTVFTPAPGGGTSAVLAFFVTEAAAGVIDQQVAGGTDPTAGIEPATATAAGEGLLAVAEYDANPGGTPSFDANGTYFDVYAAPGNSFSQVSIVACGLNANDKLYWWDAAQGKWVKAGPQSYDQGTGCVTLVVDANSSPSLSQLQGTYLAVGQEPNTAPVANPGGPYLGAINTAIAMDGSASSDPDGDPLAYAWSFGDGSNGDGAAPGHSYAETGVYDVCLVVSDGMVDSDRACTLAAVYDPDGGFVTGGGWIASPAGAYLPDPALAGKATFGFVSRYQKGAQVPTGTTEFQFQAGGFNFHSETYEWLVVNQAGKNAQFKGGGTVNDGLDPNGNEYKFMIWATDGSPDSFRIKIWWEDGDIEIDVYDNGVEQAIGGGSIVVHAK